MAKKREDSSCLCAHTAKWFGLLVNVRFGFARFEHFARAEIRGHVYYIDSIWKVGVGHNSKALFALFECDKEGTLCQIVHSEYVYPNEEEYEAMQVALIPHLDGNKISMQIDGKIVYTHHL